MIAEANFRHNDINSFLAELGEAQDKEKFFKEYVKSVRLNDQKVNSVISLYSNQEILKEYYAGVEKEFHGVPILLKDNIDSIGIANTAGSLAFKNNLPKNDAPLVSKLRESGFIILGKVKCYQGRHALTNMFLKKLLDAKSSIKIFELKDDVISKKINNSQSIKLAVSA